MQAICTHKITDKKFPLPKNRGLVLPLCLVFAVVFPCVENDLGPLLVKWSPRLVIDKILPAYCTV